MDQFAWSHWFCFHWAERIFAEAGTRDEIFAAQWYALGTVERRRAEAEQGRMAGLYAIEPEPS